MHILAASPIGEIPVVITGDWSELQVAIDQAANAASAGAQQIASAFESTGSNTDLFTGISDQVAAASTSMEEMAGSVTIVEDNLAALSAAAVSAEAGIETVPPALHDVSESSHEAEVGLAEFGEQLLKFGEALAITEGLKEFAEAALEAFGAEEKATISLAALTGSMEEAEKTVADLKEMAIGQALSFESLVTATQRMTAFGFSAQETSKTLQAAADAAAATAKPIEAVTSAIDRMVLSGNAGGRQLAALGISMKTLGEAMGVAADQAKTAFAALDQSARIEAITAALQKYAGVAAQAAQGLAGQMTSFANRIEDLIQEVGKAIAPLVEDLLKFASTEVIPFLMDMAAAFNSLPGPVKEFAVAIAALGVAIPVVALSMGALSMGLAAAETALGPMVAALEGIKLALSGMEGPLTLAQTRMVGLGSAVAVAAAAFAGWELGKWLYQNVPELQKLGDAIADLILKIPGLQSVIDRFTGVTAAEGSLAAATQQLNDKLQNLGAEVVRNAGESMESFAVRVRAAASAMSATGDAVGKVLPYMQALQKALLTVDDENQKLKDNFNAASLALEAATLAYQYHSITLGELKAKQDAYNTALYAMNPAAKAAADAAKAFADQIVALNTAVESVSIEAFAALGTNAANADGALAHVTTTINQLLDAMQKTSNPKTLQGLQDSINLLAKLQTQLQSVVDQKAFDALGAQLDGLLTKYPHALDTMGAATQQWAASVIAATQKARDSFENLTDKQVIDDFENSLKGLSESADKLANDFNVSVGKMHTAAAEQVKITVDWREEVGKLANSYMEMTTLATKYHLNEIASLAQELTDLKGLLTLQQQFNVPLSQQLATEAKLLQTQIDMGAATGETAQQTLEWQQQLSAVQIKQNLLKQDTLALANLYKDMVSEFGKAWDNLGKNIGDALVDGQNFGAAISKVFDDLKKSLAELVTNYLLGELKRAFLENTDAVSTFGKVFSGIFGGEGSVGSVQTALDSFDKALMSGMDKTVATVSEAGNAVQSSATQMSSSMQKTAQSVSASASQMVTGLTAVATVVSAIASIFSAIELMHTNTLLDRIEHETARMAIYLGDQSQSILWSTQTSAAMLTYIHETIVQMSGDLQAIRATLTSILGVVASGGGSGSGNGSVSFAALQKEIQDALNVFKEEIAGPYGLGPMVQGFGGSVSEASTGLSNLSTSAYDLGSTFTDVTSTATQAAASITSMSTQLAKAVGVSGPGTPGFNAMVQPTPATPTAAPVGALGYNTMVQPMTSVNVNVTTGGILGVQTATQLAKVVQDQIVSRLQTQGIRVTRG